MTDADQERDSEMGSVEMDAIEPVGVAVRVGRGVVAAVLVVGLLYLFGGRQYFLLQRTPEGARQSVVESSLEAETLAVPLTVFIVVGDGDIGSERSEADVWRLVENAARIWEQADVALVVERIVTLPVSESAWRLFTEKPRAFIATVEAYDATTVNVFLVSGLGGVNGLSFGGINSVAVADYTSVHDFRTLAHEIGHTLGLDHVGGHRGRLMYRGANGVTLSPEEIRHARLGVARVLGVMP